MPDIRLYRLKKTMDKVKNIISVASGKGGVGKTTISTVLSLILSERGYITGLLDLDFHGPSCHTILGIDKMEYEEEKGINPYKAAENLYFASIYPFVKNGYVPLRGMELSNALIEFLSILNWKELDCLIIDMPPGMGDVLLDFIRLVPSPKFLIVATNSALVIQTVRRLIKFMIEGNFNILGIVANMIRNDDALVRELAKEFSIKFLGSVPFDQYFEKVLGNMQEILRTNLAAALSDIVEQYIKLK
ncbi:MAG: P-loop NTPase [Crenarchaeota archaeon]|nr:P-loop NTPase [Thermoproteota archaeon]MCR8500953.1 P-loop NTPase [Thermoproteota archaeon]